jgi:hypothetical protein
LPQSAENWPAKASTGAAFGNANPMGAPALGGWATRNEILADDSQTGDVRLSAEESVYCPDTTRRADTGLHEPLPGGRSGPNCVVR